MSLFLPVLSPLKSSLWTSRQKLLTRVLLVVLAAALIAISAHAKTPWLPVSFTLQSTVVVAIGLLAGRTLGVASVVVYLLAGLAGLPVFADAPLGIAAFFSPTAGYLFGFLPAAWIAGTLAEQGFGKNRLFAFIAGFVSLLPIFALGYFFLSLFVGYKMAWALGVEPFALTEPLKLCLLSLIVPKFWKKIH